MPKFGNGNGNVHKTKYQLYEFLKCGKLSLVKGKHRKNYYFSSVRLLWKFRLLF